MSGMAYHAAYGYNRTGGTSNRSSGLSAGSHSTLPATKRPLASERSSSTRCSKTSNQYLSPNRTWEQERRLSPTRLSYEASRIASLYSKPSRDVSTDRAYSKTERAGRPHSVFGWPNQDHLLGYQLNHQEPQRSRSPGYRSGDYGGHARARSPSNYRSSGIFVPSRNTVWTDLSKRSNYPKTKAEQSSYSGGRAYQEDFSKIPRNTSRTTEKRNTATRYSRDPEVTDWRARMAQHGYTVSTAKRRPAAPREWRYVEDDEVEGHDESFVYRTTRGTADESVDESNCGIVSRERRVLMKVLEGTPEQKDFSAQVDPEDLKTYLEQEERRIKKTFISSRHHSLYDTGATSYNKYLSPMPWRGSTSYSSSRYVPRKNSYCDSPPSEEPAALEDVDIELEDSNKDYRKSVLNVDLPESEAELFARRQAETRWRKGVDDVSYTSEDGSPSETGYESHSSCTDRSSETEVFTDSMDRSLSSVPRDLSFFEMSSVDGQTSCAETAYKAPTDILVELKSNLEDIILKRAERLERHDSFESQSTEAEMSPREDRNLRDLCFRFRSLNDASSQRDSGFSEIYNRGDSPYDNISEEAEVPHPKISKLVNPTSKFIGDCKDIDDFLLSRDFNGTFEDFERQMDRQKHNVRVCNTTPSTWAKPGQVGFHLDLTKSRFIGSCQDIDEMLGKPSPLSPEENSSSTTVLGKNDADGVTTDDDVCDDVGDGDSTTATSIILGSLDVADVRWLTDCEASSIEGDGLCSSNCLQEPNTLRKLDDCTLQLYRYNGSESDYANYLDLESTIDEQAEEFEGFHQNRKNAIILRTQLSVRVHAIIEKLVNSSGRELRRALFSLKQIFQDDKDLVHEFVQNDGLACLIKVGSEADQNYQNYILRALGQVMLYVDGMNGIIEHIETVQWLYSLISSKYRLVVKTALKLLLVFVEYTELNSQLLMNAVDVVDSDKGALPWSNIMNLLKERDTADTELLVYAVTLINKTLNGIPDQDNYYDMVDNLEEQGIENVIQYYMCKQGTDLDLLQQFQIYEAVLKHEDGVLDNNTLPLDARFRQVPRSRKSCPDDNDRRKSRRHSVGTLSNGTSKQNHSHRRSLENTPEESPFKWKDRNQNHIDEPVKLNGCQKNNVHLNGNGLSDSCHDTNGITPALKRRRERDARNKSLIKEQEQNGKGTVYHRSDSLSSSSSVLSDSCENSPLVKEDKQFLSIVERRRSLFENNVDHENRKNNELSKLNDDKSSDEDKRKPSNDITRPNSLNYTLGNTNKKSWMLSMMYGKSQEDDTKPHSEPLNSHTKSEIVNNNYIMYNKLKEEDTPNGNVSTVKDMQEKFIYRNGDVSVRSPTSEVIPELGVTTGIINRAKEGLAASKKRDSKPTSPLSPSSSFIQDIKKPESDLQWEQLINSVKRPLVINDLDFTDLKSDEDMDLLGSLAAEMIEMNGGPPPPPLPTGLGPPPPPPPLPLGGGPVPPPPPPQFNNFNRGNNFTSRIPTVGETPSVPPTWMKRNQHHGQDTSRDQQSKNNQKTKKTVKLFWREVKEDQSLLRRIGKKKTIWDELKPVPVDTQKLEHLFENRAKDVMNKEKTQEGTKKNEIIVLDTKRSNAINIGMTKLPPPRTIKTAILKMDSTIMNREGIEKILTTMLPSEDEKARIAEAQVANSDVPLGTAEQFLLTLASISELEARLRLWAFRLDYETMEREVAEPLMDLKQAMKEIESNETFRVILSTLRSVGNFLNGVEIKGFHIEYLSKVPEVKDTVQKHSLLHHLCHIVMEKFPKSSDLYSEIGAVTRASKIDYGEVTKSLNKMENECKASWDYLKAIAKHDCNITMKVRTSEFLTDCAERIIVLKVVHRRMINRYHKFLVYLGCTSQSIEELPIQKSCKILSEFALEYRTTRERVLQQIEKKANHRERNKTRGKMITDMERFRTKEQQADHELRQLLGNGNSNSDDHKSQKWGTVPGMRNRIRPQIGPGGSLGRHSLPAKEENLTDADDEILESLVKTATTQLSRNEPRIRKKARYGDRKSLRRTLKNGLELSAEERNILNMMTT